MKHLMTLDNIGLSNQDFDINTPEGFEEAKWIDKFLIENNGVSKQKLI